MALHRNRFLPKQFRPSKLREFHIAMMSSDTPEKPTVDHVLKSKRWSTSALRNSSQCPSPLNRVLRSAMAEAMISNLLRARIDLALRAMQGLRHGHQVVKALSDQSLRDRSPHHVRIRKRRKMPSAPLSTPHIQTPHLSLIHISEPT